MTPENIQENVHHDKSDTVQVDDKVYLTSSLAAMHPGGELFVKAFSGRDATEAFLSYHRRSFPHSIMTKHLVATAIPLKDKENDKDYLELCKIIEKVLPREKAFAPYHYYLKIVFILSVTFGLEFYMHATKFYVWYLSIIQGVFMALIGLNIQHDANHGAISRNPWVNRTLGFSQNWIGGSAISWIHQHVVQHHIHCNDVHNDPDINGNFFLRLNPLKDSKYIYFYQHAYAFIIIGFFGFTVCVDSFIDVLYGRHFTPMAKQLKPNRFFDSIISMVYFLRWIALPLYQVPSIYTFLNICPMFIVGGYYLAFFFILSHNFVGVHFFDKNSKTHNYSFLYRQASSSSNVGGAFLCFINGGLNYQIEHHLFPRIQHSHYPKIAPFVREYCLSKNIPYKHFPTISENMISTMNHLFNLGHKITPANFEK